MDIAGRISKPQAHFSIKNLATTGVVDSYTGKDCNWPIPGNSGSVTNARKIYIPVETADGTYDIALYIEGVSYNGKPVSKTIHKSITVKGNLYEDDYTSLKD